MKTFKTTALQDQLTAKLAAMPCGDRTFSGAWWGRGETAERFYFGRSAEIAKDGKPIRGIKAWLQFDDPATLEGCALKVQAPKRWYEVTLAQWHAAAVIAAIELVDPMQAAALRLELATADSVGDFTDTSLARTAVRIASGKSSRGTCCAARTVAATSP